MIKKKIFGALWILAAIAALFVFVDQKILKDYSNRNVAVEMVSSVPAVDEIKREMVAPAALLSTTTPKTPRNQVSSSLLITLTNKERQKQGLPALGDNFLLDSAALAKAKDMFAKQYFEHTSPSGENASNFVTKEGYDYFIIGENLASGGFRDAQSIVSAWMASAGHRENILNPKYREVGAAAALGKFEGKSVLFAVQIFGTPTSICPKPDDSIRAKIEDATKIIDAKKPALDTMYNTIDTVRTSDANTAKINEYNILVREYNGLVDQAKNLVTVYNEQVRQFSECATAAAR